MKKAMSWIHFIGCVGWLLFWFAFMVLDFSAHGVSAFSHWSVIVSSIALLITAGTGIYLFVAESNTQLHQLKKFENENKILHAKLEQAKLQKELASTCTNPDESNEDQ